MVGHVRDQLAQGLLVHEVRGLGRQPAAAGDQPVSLDDHVSGAAGGGERARLLRQVQLLAGAGPLHDRHVARLLRQRLEQGTQRHDADPGAEEQHLPAASDSGVQPPVRPFDEHSGPGPQGRQPGTAVAAVGRGQAQAPAVGSSRHRVRVATCPAGAVEEAPDEELARLHAHPRHAGAGHGHRRRTPGPRAGRR